MSISEFRYNRRRKHFSYIFGKNGNSRKHILISSKSKRKIKNKNGKYKVKDNVKLFKHPNPLKKDDSYVIPDILYDDISTFDEVKKTWKFHKYDKRKIKRIKKGKWK